MRKRCPFHAEKAIPGALAGPITHSSSRVFARQTTFSGVQRTARPTFLQCASLRVRRGFLVQEIAHVQLKFGNLSLHGPQHGGAVQRDAEAKEFHHPWAARETAARLDKFGAEFQRGNWLLQVPEHQQPQTEPALAVRNRHVFGVNESEVPAWLGPGKKPETPQRALKMHRRGSLRRQQTE